MRDKSPQFVLIIDSSVMSFALHQLGVSVIPQSSYTLDKWSDANEGMAGKVLTLYKPTQHSKYAYKKYTR